MKPISRIQEIAGLLPVSLMDEAEELFELSFILKGVMETARDTLILCALIDKSGQAKKAAEAIEKVNR